MLTERQIPLEISSLKGSHCRVMLGLFRYADKQGVCWPGLRTLAEAVPMSIRALRRALDEMAAAGYLAITKAKGMGNRYRIAAKFLRAMGHTVRPRMAPETVAEASLPDEVDERQLTFDFGRTVSLSCTGVSPLRTEGIAKESQEDFIKEEGIPFGRDAPLEETPDGKVIKIAEIPGLKAKKKELRRQKVTRFINAIYAGEDHRVRIEGMYGCDPIRDEQWWFDKCDAEMRLAKWDDVRNKHQENWQRIA
jgi:hypothetical protein